MNAFWIWGVRNPALALAALGLAAGVAGVASWSLAFIAATAGTVIADSANHLATRARQRARRLAMALDTERAARAMRERGQAFDGTNSRHAA